MLKQMRLLHKLEAQSLESGCSKLVDFSAEYFLLGLLETLVKISGRYLE